MYLRPINKKKMSYEFFFKLPASCIFNMEIASPATCPLRGTGEGRPLHIYTLMHEVSAPSCSPPAPLAGKVPNRMLQRRSRTGGPIGDRRGRGEGARTGVSYTPYSALSINSICISLFRVVKYALYPEMRTIRLR